MKNNYKAKTEAKMKLLGVSSGELAEMFDKPIPRVSEALAGDMAQRAAVLRVQIDQALTGLVTERRRELEAQLEEARDDQFPDLEGRLSVIMPEDMIYIVTEDGIPVGTWNPVSKTYADLDAVIMPLVNRRGDK